MSSALTGHAGNRLHFISAGAGSGKTYRLTQILSAELTSGRAQAAGVIATTFTKKAAAELRERVREHLLKEGKLELANAMGQARIGTVNSVCGSFLERFAFEAGLATEQQVLEENQSTLLIKVAIDEAVSGADVAALNALAARLGIEEWQSSLKDLLDKARANDILPAALAAMADANADSLLAHFPAAAKGDLTQEMLAQIAHCLAELKPKVAASGKKNSADYLGKLLEFQRKLSRNQAAWSEWLALAKAEPEKSLKPLAEPIGDIARRYDQHPGLHDDLRAYLTLMFALAAQTLTLYADRKRELGVIDFTDQEHLLLGLLDDPAVSAVLGDELDLLLVDEFQDTSPIQLALFMKLAKLAKQTYWVGDIKQAIYGFRGSDTRLMEALVNALPALGGDKTILDSSWRSRASLVHLVNHAFTAAFANTLARDEVVLQPQRKDVLTSTAFAHWVLSGNNKGQRGSALAEGVKRCLSSGYQVFDKHSQSARALRYGDIAILSRSNAGVQELAAELRAKGIPVVAAAQAGLLATPEAHLALACLRRLNDSRDTIATAEILSMADCAAPESWVADRLNYLAGEGDKTLWKESGVGAHPLLLTIAGLRAALPLLAPREALQTVIIRCDLPRIVLQWQANTNAARQRLANLESLLEMADRYEDSCRSTQQAATISGLILWLKAEAEAKQDKLAEPAVDAVKILTHHAAKGLEWPVVILTDLNAHLRDQTRNITATAKSGIDVHQPLKDRFIRYWPWPFGKQSAGIEVAKRVALSAEGQAFQREAVEEAKRLLYVSMTRARDLLILAIAENDKSRPWLETVAADGLLPAGSQASTLTLAGGETIAYEQWKLAASDEEKPGGQAEAADAPVKPLHWFATPPERPRHPLYFSASGAAPIPCAVLESVQVGQRIPIILQPDLGALGTALHACIGAHFTDVNAPLDEAEASGILAGFEVAACLSARDVLRQVHALQEWINGRWPAAQVIAEVPIELRLNNGQHMSGRIDLLLKLPDGWVLIDHKSSPLAAEQWPELAAQYSGQLAAYADAIEQTTGMPVLERWLFLPVAAGAVRLDRPRVPGVVPETGVETHGEIFAEPIETSLSDQAASPL
ncbi:MAG: ATP-dependent helicase/nuclease subunit A [Candidatus Accumulibacter appositus]|uniref:DNA 3'-5' helicase n=1 Tax=Candidatus Accumulibacter appositus TaxID=1454003 RepID=A0A011QSD5_9PROT|nr:UvrD-helicase domain-containing protein [Accumulibacter sp.]EXI81774.1 MAG: ATP-dependent helicase/nuclease subunit A [Candidatus Accumulibacter appositus]HRF04149.1 UvrD-helicase domain-containing protein [Accumulibacter sp.]